MVVKLKKIILTLLIIITILFIALFIFVFFTGSSITIGHYIQSDSGEHLMADKTAPTVMHTDHDFMFRNLTSGDKILVIHGPENLSYPGSTGVYFCLKISNGELSDIPSKILLELYDLGWIGGNESNFPYKFQRANYQDGLASMTLTLFDTWEYEYVSAKSMEEPYGIAFWPKDVTEGRIELLCYPNGYHVKCGTGLQTDQIELNGFEATKGYYDPTESFAGIVPELVDWSYIHFDGLYSNYVFHNYSNEMWTEEHFVELEYILNKVDFPYLVIS